MTAETQNTVALADEARAIVAGRSSISAGLAHLEAVFIYLDDADAECGALRAEMDGRNDDLRELRDEGARMTQYIARIEAANTRLHHCLAEEQRERELLVASVGSALGELSEYFRQANRLRGKGTPRDEPHSLTLERRYDVVGA